LQSQGPRGLARRVLRVLNTAVGGDQADLDLRPEDVADSATIRVHPWAAPSSDRLDVAFVSSPPSHGSGGHTTTLRFVEALETAGHRCVFYLYDRFDGDAARHEEALRSWWPRVQAEVR